MTTLKQALEPYLHKDPYIAEALYQQFLQIYPGMSDTTQVRRPKKGGISISREFPTLYPELSIEQYFPFDTLDWKVPPLGFYCWCRYDVLSNTFYCTGWECYELEKSRNYEDKKRYSRE